MKRINCLLLALTLGLLCLCACGKTPASVDVSALAKELTENVTYIDELTEIDRDKGLELYNISDAVEAKVYVGSGATAEEAAVFELASEQQADEVYAAVQKRIENRKADYSKYVPAEVQRLEKAVVCKAGKYVAVCVTEDEAAAEIMQRYLGN